MRPARRRNWRRLGSPVRAPLPAATSLRRPRLYELSINRDFALLPRPVAMQRFWPHSSLPAPGADEPDELHCRRHGIELFLAPPRAAAAATEPEIDVRGWTGATSTTAGGRSGCRPRMRPATRLTGVTRISPCGGPHGRR
ncbi:hypothetical protein [Streptomyces sp. NPDC048248]|uniref:hypothetical protein n=1 Tax=Streptomyces sp. NPDC048248 TaxID=3365523 RepID=UPI00372445DD